MARNNNVSNNNTAVDNGINTEETNNMVDVLTPTETTETTEDVTQVPADATSVTETASDTVIEEGADAAPAPVVDEAPLEDISDDRQTEILSIISTATSDLKTISEKQIGRYDAINKAVTTLKFAIMGLTAKSKTKAAKEKKVKEPKAPKESDKTYTLVLENVERIFAADGTPGTFDYKQRDEDKSFVVSDGTHTFTRWADVYYLSSSLVKAVKAKGVKLAGDYESAMWMGVFVDPTANEKYAVSITGAAPQPREKKAKKTTETAAATETETAATTDGTTANTDEEVVNE